MTDAPRSKKAQVRNEEPAPVVSWPASALHLALYARTDRRPARQRLAQGVSQSAVPEPDTAQIFGKATARCEGDKNKSPNRSNNLI